MLDLRTATDTESGLWKLSLTILYATESPPEVTMPSTLLHGNSVPIAQALILALDAEPQ